LGIPEIDFACPENGGALRATEILRGDVAFHAAEHRCFTFANMIRHINEGEQSDQADDDARAGGKPWSGGWGGYIGRARRLGLHVNLLAAV